MKKILVLVAGKSNLPFIKEAKKHGFYIITCDNNPKNTGHALADENLIIDVYDYKSIIKKIKTKNINFVFSFVSAHGLLSASKIAEYFGLPGYSSEHLKTLMNKDLFREFLKQKDLDFPGFQSVRGLKEVDKTKLNFPLIIKPVDGGGSRGVKRINDYKDLEEYFSKAQNNAKSGKVIIEEFIQSDKLINGDCLISNGKIIGHLIGDYIYDKGLNEVLPLGTIFPSKYNLDRALDQVENIVSALRVPDGIINFEAILKNGKAYIVEINPRPSGNYIWQLMGYKYNINTPKFLLTLNNRENDFKPEVTAKKWYYAYHLIYADRNKSFEGLAIPKKIQKSIKEILLFKNKGDKVKKLEQLNDRIGLVLLEFQNEREKNNYLNNLNFFEI